MGNKPPKKCSKWINDFVFLTATAAGLRSENESLEKMVFFLFGVTAVDCS
jgi:hypothetical protein